MTGADHAQDTRPSNPRQIGTLAFAASSTRYPPSWPSRSAFRWLSFGLFRRRHRHRRARHGPLDADRDHGTGETDLHERGIPIIVDADTGYGNPLNVYRTVQELIAAGAAGCFLEDQLWPKKCGHMQGKRVIEGEEYVQKIRAAVDARGDRDFFIVARTDALAVAGMDEAVSRILAARGAGADASFIEAPNSIDSLPRSAAACPSRW